MIRVRLLHPDREPDTEAAAPWNADALRTDLALDSLFGAMAAGDDYVRAVATGVVLAGVEADRAVIEFRQGVLEDALRYPDVVRDLYGLAGETRERAKKHYLGSLARYPAWVLRHGRELMETLVEQLRTLRTIADRHQTDFASDGWRRFFAMVRSELSDAYLAEVERKLLELRFPGGLLVGARPGPGAKGEDYVLNLAPWRPPTWWERFRDWLFGPTLPPCSFAIHPRDLAGHRALEELQSRWLADVAHVLGHAAEQVRAFFETLRWELAFYVGCINLHEALRAKGMRVSIPNPAEPGERRLDATGLYDPTLALSVKSGVVANSIAADGAPLILITGANQGGKTTFLRSLGLAQLMMQSGMFVAADAFAASLCRGLMTHYKRPEDAAMESGKLDEELRRMSDIVDHLRPGAFVLLNEPFSATNEREGSEIGRQILTTLLEREIRVGCVTHLFELARGFAMEPRGQTVFLRAERRSDGSRTYRLLEGEPLSTSFGPDLYRQVFGDEVRRPAVTQTETP